MAFLERFYPLIPAFGAFVWCGGLMAMLITWAGQGKPHYVSQEGSIPYIGADILKPMFITVCSITAVCFVLSLVIERWLRHVGRLLPNMKRRERVFAGLAILGCLIGGAGLILLSVFDTKRHEKAHRGFLLIFMVGVVISAIFTCLEFRWLNKAHIHSSRLRRSYIAKGLIATILILLSIAFAATLARGVHNTSGILEWIIGFGFTFYLVTFIFDLIIADEMISDSEARGLWNRSMMRQRAR